MAMNIRQHRELGFEEYWVSWYDYRVPCIRDDGDDSQQQPQRCLVNSSLWAEGQEQGLLPYTWATQHRISICSEGQWHRFQ